jgi:hypothetical protein
MTFLQLCPHRPDGHPNIVCCAEPGHSGDHRYADIYRDLIFLRSPLTKAAFEEAKVRARDSGRDWYAVPKRMLTMQECETHEWDGLNWSVSSEYTHVDGLHTFSPDGKCHVLRIAG